MTTRTRAVRATFNSMLSAVELLIAIGFVLKFFSSDGTLGQLIGQAGGFMEEVGRGSPSSSLSADTSGSMKFLMVILAFMSFGYFMMVFFPKMVRKKEEELDIEDSL